MMVSFFYFSIRLCYNVLDW